MKSVTDEQIELLDFQKSVDMTRSHSTGQALSGLSLRETLKVLIKLSVQENVQAGEWDREVNARLVVYVSLIMVGYVAPAAF
jgi:hypothetical protein